MDPFSLATGVIGLVGVALKLVTGAVGLINKTIAARAEAADELNKLEVDLEDLQVKMKEVHTLLKVMAKNTKDRGFKKLLQKYAPHSSPILWGPTNVSSSEDSKAALTDLCVVLDDTYVILQRLTDQTEAQKSRLRSQSPGDAGSLAFVLAVLRGNITPTKATDLVNGLRDMRSEIQSCLKRLDTAFQHIWRLYFTISIGLARTPSTGSTSSSLTIRIKFVDWLKDRQIKWGLSAQRNETIMVSIVIMVWPHESRSVFHSLSHLSPYTRVCAFSRG